MHATGDETFSISRQTEQRRRDSCVQVVVIKLSDPFERLGPLTVTLASERHTFRGCASEVREYRNRRVLVDPHELRSTKWTLHLLEHEMVAFDPEMLFANVQRVKAGRMEPRQVLPVKRILQQAPQAGAKVPPVRPDLRQLHTVTVPLVTAPVQALASGSRNRRQLPRRCRGEVHRLGPVSSPGLTDIRTERVAVFVSACARGGPSDGRFLDCLGLGPCA